MNRDRAISACPACGTHLWLANDGSLLCPTHGLVVYLDVLPFTGDMADGLLFYYNRKGPGYAGESSEGEGWLQGEVADGEDIQ